MTEQPALKLEPDPIVALINAAKAQHGGSLGALADALRARGIKGLSRAALSGRINGTYCAGTEALDARIRAALEAPVACPHLGQEIGRAECAEFRRRRMPKSNPDALRHWTACQSCQVGAALAAEAGAA